MVVKLHGCVQLCNRLLGKINGLLTVAAKIMGAMREHFDRSLEQMHATANNAVMLAPVMTSGVSAIHLCLGGRTRSINQRASGKCHRQRCRHAYHYERLFDAGHKNHS